MTSGKHLAEDLAQESLVDGSHVRCALADVALLLSSVVTLTIIISDHLLSTALFWFMSLDGEKRHL